MNFIIQLIYWLKRGKYIWCLLVALFGLFCFPKLSIPFCVEQKIEIYGLFLQVVGSFFLVKSINHRFKIFEGKNLINRFCTYWRDMPIGRKQYTIRMEGKLISSSSSDAKLVKSVGELKSNDPESIKIYIDANVSAVKSEFNEHIDDLTSKIETLKRNQKESETGLKKETESIKEDIRKISVDENGEELFSVLLILTGMIYSGLSFLLASWFN